MKTICYMSLGYPSIPRSLEMAELYLEAGCDSIECSIPARDPYMEPEFLAARAADALELCGDYEEYLRALGAFLERRPGTPIVLLLYEATVVEIGPARLLEFCAAHGVWDLIYAGLKDHRVRQELVDGGMRICSPVLRSMKEEDIQAAISSTGFVYMEAKSQTVHPEHDTLAKCIAQLRRRGVDRPIYCGVGIHSPEDVRLVREAGGDGYFIGSALLKLYDKPQELRETIAAFRAAAEQ